METARLIEWSGHEDIGRQTHDGRRRHIGLWLFDLNVVVVAISALEGVIARRVSDISRAPEFKDHGEIRVPQGLVEAAIEQANKADWLDSFHGSIQELTVPIATHH